MNILISVIYAPLVFISLRYFDIKLVSVVVFCFSLLWAFFIFKKNKDNLLYPFLYAAIAVVTFFLEEFIVLKSLPLLISIVITSIILISYINKKSVILYFASKFSKNKIEKKEMEYIQKSTFFWVAISLINVVCHIFVLLSEHIEFWLYYSSLGWYTVFVFGGVLQFLHRKFVFLKGNK